MALRDSDHAVQRDITENNSRFDNTVNPSSALISRIKQTEQHLSNGTINPARLDDDYDD